MAKKLPEKIWHFLNEQFRVKMPETLTEVFGDKGFTTEWNLFAGSFGGLVTSWSGKTSPQQKKQIIAYTNAYEAGYTDAMDLVFNFGKTKND